MTGDPVFEELRSYVARAFRDGATAGLEADTPLVTSGIIDSAGVVQLVLFIEQRFAVRVADAEVTIEHFNSLAELAAFVRAKLG